MNKKFYRALYRIRRVEEEIAKIYPTDRIQSPIHLSIGQESISIGICEALDPKDVVFGTYRSHALYLAKGADLKKLICELYGKAAGCCHGKGGSLHLAGPDHGFMGTSAIVASNIPHAVGYTYALKLKGSKNVVANFFGDGAVEEGVFYESLNFAALKKIPVLFVCENNELAVHSRQNERQSICNIAEKVSRFGIPVDSFDGRDIHSLYEKTRAVVDAMRTENHGPHFFECKTSRWREHVGPAEDFHAGYRSREEVQPWMEADVLKTIRKSLPVEEVEKIEAEIENEIREAFEAAEASAMPEDHELFTDVFSSAVIPALAKNRGEVRPDESRHLSGGKAACLPDRQGIQMDPPVKPGDDI